MIRRYGVRGFCLFGAAVAIAIAAIGPAAAQDVQNLLNRLDRMERDMQDLQRQLYRNTLSTPGAGGAGTGITATPVSPAPITGGPGTSDSAGGQPGSLDTSYAARVEVRLQQLETLIRSLTGKIEEVEFRVEQNSGRLDRLVRDIDFRLQALEQGGAPARTDGQGGGALTQAPQAENAPVPGQGQGVLGTLSQAEIKAVDEGTVQLPAAEGEAASKPEAVASAPASGQILPDGTPEEQYKHAFAYLQKQDFDSAEKALSLFLERHPKSPLAGNAMYWLGETYYVRKDFPLAAKTFATGYTDYPGSSKTADNLLKLGFSLARMDRKEDACVTFDKLRADFPNASDNIKRRADAERKRIGC
jgi:tol-pal system protein YbgF